MKFIVIRYKIGDAILPLYIYEVEPVKFDERKCLRKKPVSFIYYKYTKLFTLKNAYYNWSG